MVNNTEHKNMKRETTFDDDFYNVLQYRFVIHKSYWCVLATDISAENILKIWQVTLKHSDLTTWHRDAGTSFRKLYHVVKKVPVKVKCTAGGVSKLLSPLFRCTPQITLIGARLIRQAVSTSHVLNHKQKGQYRLGDDLEVLSLRYLFWKFEYIFTITWILH